MLARRVSAVSTYADVAVESLKCANGAFSASVEEFQCGVSFFPDVVTM